MNIVYLHSHDAGRYIQPYGVNVETPSLQLLAEQGVMFRQAHCGNPTCSPSRACLLTGQAAHSAGMYGLAHRGWSLRDYGQTLMSTLKNIGYETILCGQHHIGSPEKAGYTEILNDRGGFDETVEAASTFLNCENQKPFFLDVGFFAPHRTRYGGFPSTVERPDARYVMPPPTLPDTPETREDFALYSASVQSMDKAMGNVLTALEERGLADKTLVICTTDHGIAFPHMKCRLTDHGTGVMLLMRGPGGFDGGKVVDSLVSHIDIFPTICEVLNIAPPDWLQGQSLVPVTNGDTSNEREAVFAEVNYHASKEPMRSVRTKRWKYIRRYGQFTKTILPNIDASLSKIFLYDNGLRDRLVDSELLFDLYYDPQETNNLASNPSHTKILNELSEKLDKWMRETEDPLLCGDLPTTENLKETPAVAFSSWGGTVDEREKLPWSAELIKQSKFYNH